LFSAAFVLPVVSFAQGLAAGNGDGGDIGTFFGGVLDFINEVLLPLILGIAFLMFVWGVFQFFILGGSDEEAQSKGKSLMIYAVAGFVLILSFYGIVNVITNGLGFQGKDNTIDVPVVPKTI
jgi:K+-transporting ATPase A subunit